MKPIKFLAAAAGRKQAEGLARQVLKARGQLPALQAVQAQLLQSEHLEAWQRHVLAERAQHLSAAERVRRPG